MVRSKHEHVNILTAPAELHTNTHIYGTTKTLEHQLMMMMVLRVHTNERHEEHDGRGYRDRDIGSLATQRLALVDGGGRASSAASISGVQPNERPLDLGRSSMLLLLPLAGRREALGDAGAALLAAALASFLCWRSTSFSSFLWRFSVQASIFFCSLLESSTFFFLNIGGVESGVV